MVYPIVKFGDPVLENEAESVTDFDTPELHQFLEDMFNSMYAAKGVGLAAPQIGFGRKIAVIDVSNGERPEDKLVLINPKIVQVRRGRVVTIRAQNVHGEEFEKTGEDLLARAFLHETDHLYGRLYISHISALKRDLMKRKIKKLQRAGDWD
jgi:peptide deformylase